MHPKAVSKAMSLPILSSQFFEKHSPNLGFFSKWSSLFAWSDQILPIYEWQDILYVGCLQPPAQFPKSTHKIVFLLCEPEALKRVWYNFEGTVVSQTKPSLPNSKAMVDDEPLPPLGLDSADVADFKLDMGAEAAPAFESAVPTFELDVEAAEPALEFPAPVDAAEDSLSLQAEMPPPPPPEFSDSAENSTPSLSLNLEMEVDQSASARTEADAPVGLELSLDSAPLPMESIAEVGTQTSAETTLPAAEIPKLDSSPESLLQDVSEENPGEADEASIHEEVSGLLDLTGGLQPEALSAENDGPQTSTSTSPLVALQSSAASTSSRPAVNLFDATSTLTTPLKSAKPTAAPAENQTAKTKKPAAAEDLTPIAGVNPSHDKRATPVSSEAVTMNSEITRISIQALKSAPIETMGTWIEKLFAELGSHYKKSMILLKSGDQVKPWKWDSNFKSSTPSVTSISLLQPSPFRIVHRTHKPFHGYVVPNELNDKFFAQWNDSTTPEHLTIAPVMIEDHVIGMLLAIGNKSADTKACLQLTETLADGIAKQIKATPKAA